jgi:transcriptional regulator with XRE-family HTH domain
MAVITMLGEILKKLRSEKELMQKDVASALNITTSAYGFYEQGERIPNAETLEKLADYFNVSVDFLLGRTNLRNKKSELLNNKDKRDIEKIIEQTKNQLMENEGLMFDGEPATPEAIQSILDAMRVGLEIAKQRNKEKYTPKKYKKDE